MIAILIPYLIILPITASMLEKNLLEALKSAEGALILHGDRTSHVESSMVQLVSVFDHADGPRDESHKLVSYVEDLIRQLNIKQLEQLSQRLDDTLKAEQERRLTHAGASVGQNQVVTEEYLEDVFDFSELFSESEAKLDEWTRAIINDEMGKLVALAMDVEVLDGGTDQEPSEFEANCVSAEKAVQEVQKAIILHSQDGIGRQDHAISATAIHELSSPTYIPPPSDEDRLGHEKWRRWIPEELEEVLPANWRKWDIRVPNSIYHFLGLSAPSSSLQTIFHPSVQPGTCWPFAGESGFVTFKMSTPVNVDAVTVDHIPASLLPEGKDRTSAPKNITVHGYPACAMEDCGGLGFNVHDGFVLTKIMYDIEGAPTQTFSITDTAVKNNRRQDLSSVAACTSDVASCGSNTVAEPVAAIRLEIHDNWGNEAYTCLYRFRVHGQTASAYRD